MMLLIGSRALKFHYPSSRMPKDFDFIGSEKEIKEFLDSFPHKDTSNHEKKKRATIDLGHRKISVELELIEQYPSSSYIYQHDMGTVVYDEMLKVKYRIASPSTLFLLKRSHIPFNIHWEKNIEDYLFLRKEIIKTNNLPLWWEKAFDLRFEEVKNRINKHQINFDLDNSEFFKKSEKFVGRVVEHDSLHRATCFYKEPLFLSAKDDLSKAALSEEKVALMSDNLKIQMIQEEAMVLSLERYVIPCITKKQPYDANKVYRKVAAKMVYNYLPLFLRHFAADNFESIVNLNVDYVSKCLQNHNELRNKLVKHD